MAKSLEQWKSQVFNTVMDFDNNSYDCVDVFKSWAEYVTGIGWRESAGWGNAKDIWYNAPHKHWNRIGRNDIQPGDAVCMDGSIGGGYGHVGVCVERYGNNIVIYQQNTFTQQPVYKGTYTVTSSYIQGGLRPTASFSVGAPTALLGYQRKVGSGGVNYREAPNRSGAIIKVFPAGDVLDFKGHVKGEVVDGRDEWLVGMHTAKYAHVTGFEDQDLHDLPNLTPATTLQPFQRQVGGDTINYRKAPVLDPGNVIKTFPPADILDFDAWTKGAFVNGTDIWFRGKYSGGWAHASGFTNQTPDGLPEVKLEVTPVPVEPQPEMFVKELACVTEVRPAHPSNYEKTNFPTKPTAVVLHDFGTDGRDTVESSLNHFAKQDTTAPHLLISGKRIIQCGKLSWRMYHAGKLGNDKFGIEIDPDVDTNPDTKASVELAVKALEIYVGNSLTRHLHSEFMPTACGDDVKRSGLLDAPKPEPSTPDQPVDPDSPPDEPHTEPVKPPDAPVNIQASLVRTIVPYLVGLSLTLLSKAGIIPTADFVTEFTGVVTFAVGSLYYVAVRWLETKLPQAGILLGSAKKPTYVTPLGK